MKKKRLFFTDVTLAITTATVAACDLSIPTQENMSTPKSGVLSSKSESKTLSNSLSEQESKPSHYIASGGAMVQQPFSVNPEFVHIKLLMKNNSSHEVNVTLTHLYTSKVYFARTIAAGESFDWINIKEGFTQGMNTGGYLLQWSGGGYRVEGELWGSAGADPDDTAHLSY
ncbi:pilus assembly protein [Paenibacillus amylolyticus]|uniref:pilus assembly protein n=1 Tax=Paenibacillus amylolyticus TaxID=1451 RepID=UPI003D296791